MPASNPLKPAYVQRDLSHLPASSSPLELFQITTPSTAWTLGVCHLYTHSPQSPLLIREMCGPSQSPHSFQAQRPPSLLLLQWDTGSSRRKTEGPGHRGGSCCSLILVFILMVSLHPYQEPQPKHLFRTVVFPFPFSAHALTSHFRSSAEASLRIFCRALFLLVPSHSSTHAFNPTTFHSYGSHLHVCFLSPGALIMHLDKCSDLAHLENVHK